MDIGKQERVIVVTPAVAPDRKEAPEPAKVRARAPTRRPGEGASPE